MRLLALLAPLLLLASAAPLPRAAPPAAHPALWLASDADTRIYLFGTIHALPEGTAWIDRRLDRAIEASDALLIETVLGPPAEMSALLLRIGADEAAGLPPIARRVPEKDRAALARLLAEAGVPAGAADRLETWAAAFLLSGPLIRRLGLSPEAGVEETLRRRFAARGRPVEGLEAVTEQLGLVDDLAEADQRRLLSGFIVEADDVRAEFAAMLAAWARGDDRAIARTFDKELKRSPGLRTALVTRRNSAWADALAARMSRPGTVLVAVGAGHLVGQGSVQAMLARRGIRVQRLP